MTKTISVVMATYNEEENLRNCLSSIKDLAAEIVVVDGGSKDKTLEIAKEFGARIIQTNNPSNFHINKNKAIDAAKEDWILQLDADEIVTERLRAEIKNAVDNKNINGFWIPRKNFFLNRFLTKGGQYPDYTLRLYKNGKGRLPGKDVHEQATVEGKIDYLKNDLLHIRDKNFSIYMDRYRRYTDLLASQYKERGEKINVLTFIDYLFIKPIFWFLKSFIRHRGYVDGFPGFIFAFFSALRFPVAFIKYSIMKSSK